MTALQIGVDIDGVLADLTPALRQLLGRESDDSPNSYSLSASGWVRDRVEEAELIREVGRQGLFATLPLIDGAIEGLARLREIAPVKLVTARHAEVEDQTRAWMRENDIDLPLVLQQRKIGWPILIDDSPDQVSRTWATGGFGVLFDQPWNRHVDGPRLPGWGALGVGS